MESLTKEIIPSKSEYELLIEKIQELREVVAALTTERDDLLLHTCREIQADYDIKIGNLEYQITAYNLEIERLKRIIVFMQMALNIDIKISFGEAESRANDELSDYYDELTKKAEEIKKSQEYAKRHADKAKADNTQVSNEAAQAYNSKKDEYFDAEDSSTDDQFEGNDDSEYDNESDDTTESEVEERKRLYRYIMKKLHPDNNPDITEAEKQLYYDAQKAFAAEDTNRLREIVDIIDDRDITEKYSDNADDIAKMKEYLQRLINQKETLLAELNDIKNSFPYNMKDFLADEAAVSEKQNELKTIIEELLKTIEELNRKIEVLNKEIDERWL